MRRIFRIILLASIAMLMPSFSVHPTKNTYSLTVEVNDLLNSTGMVQFALYNNDGSIPDEHYKNHYRLAREKITNGSAKIIFNNLPAGRYAVSVLHDENNNGKIDKGFILPIEGIGFSNYTSIGLRNRPSFEKASFGLSANASIVIKIIYL